MPDAHADAYDALRARVTAVIAAAPVDLLEQPAPATPEWTVREILCHMVGVVDDVVAGRLDGIATDPWTAAQVDARATATRDELLAEWDKNAGAFCDMLRAVPAEISGQAIFDSVTHEHDLRHALGVPGERDSDAIAIGWEWIVGARTRAGGPAIRFVTEHGEQVAGAGEPKVSVEAPRFELLRASSGRRSRTEIDAYGWTPAPDPRLLVAADVFTMREMPLGE